MRPVKHIIAASVLLLGTASAYADDVTDQIQEALAAYEKKDYSTALAALDAAANLIRQSKSEGWKSVLPEPLPGWEAEEAQATAMSAAMMGGGTSIVREYRKGDETVEISIFGDSPMVQAMAMMFSGAVSGPDSRLVIIDGRKVNYSKNDNSYQTLVANKVLVKVEGSEGVDDKTLRSYLRAIKFAEIEKSVQ